ncbi:MAG TPA: SIS domain-containing protein [Anaerolineaceae bacterium]|nr:SIS domain-containing protein [Anaerolineaceae bacterium]
MKTGPPEALEHVFERQAHPYHMWDGINSIPAGLEDILAQPAVEAIHEASRAVQEKSPIHLLGCGTSYFAAGAIALAIQHIAGLPAYAWEAYEFLAYPPVALEGSAVIGISHTGSTPPTVRAAEMARSLGACTVAYTDAAESALSRASEWRVASTLGVEPALPKTRSYPATLLRGYLQACELARLSGKEASGWEAALSKSPSLARQVLAGCEAQARELAERWNTRRRIVVSGGGPQHVTAQEGMLKLTETALATSTSWEIEEAVHGTWASTTEDDLVILLAIDGPGYESAARLAGGMKTIGCQVWALTDRPWEGHAVDALTALPAGEPELFMPLYAILPIYQFAYFLALVRGLSPDAMGMDNPRFFEARLQMRSTIG